MPIDSVVDRDTFDVRPNWKWCGETGSRMRPEGFDAVEIGSRGGQSAKERLTSLVLNQRMDLKKAHRVDRRRLVCDVFFPGRNLASYFT